MSIKNTFCGFACLALLLLKPAPSLSAPMMVTMLPTGNIVVQGVSGGHARKATPDEVSLWKRNSQSLSTKSPDGRYEVSKVRLEDAGETVFRVIRVRDGHTILDTKDIGRLMNQDFSAGNRLYFDGWLPGSGRIALSTDSHISSNDVWEHGVVDLTSRRLIAFNGFVSPNMKYAIVPGKPGRIEEDFQHYEVERGHRIETKGNIRWYVTPLSRNIGDYHFSPTRARPMLLAGKPFSFFYEIITQMREEDPERQQSAISFSSDGQWAVCHTMHYVSQLQKLVDVDYLVSLTTGAVRKLPGTQTRFL